MPGPPPGEGDGGQDGAAGAVGTGFVRPARPGDAPRITQVQLASWRASYAPLLPAGTLEGLDSTALTRQWAQAIDGPPSPRHHVLVASGAGGLLVGVVSLAPATDPDLDPDRDAELMELVVDPGHQGVGHGSRLLAAAADVLGADGFATACHWVGEQDETRARFLTSAGWAADGARRQLDLYGDGEVLVTELRWHAALDTPGAAPDPTGRA